MPVIHLPEGGGRQITKEEGGGDVLVRKPPKPSGGKTKANSTQMGRQE